MSRILRDCDPRRLHDHRSVDQTRLQVVDDVLARLQGHNPAAAVDDRAVPRMVMIHAIVTGQVDRHLGHAAAGAVAHGGSHRADTVHQFDVAGQTLRILQVLRVIDVLASAAARGDQQHDLAPASRQLVAEVRDGRLGTNDDGHPDAVHFEERPLLGSHLEASLKFRRPQQVLALDQDLAIRERNEAAHVVRLVAAFERAGRNDDFQFSRQAPETLDHRATIGPGA